MIECNAGGNVGTSPRRSTRHCAFISVAESWVGEDKAEKIGRQMHIDQFGAFDRAAEVLVRKTRELAA